MKSWKEGDISGVLISVPNESLLAFVYDNLRLLKKIGKYEEALLEAYTAVRANYSNWSMFELGYLFLHADIVKLRNAGDPNLVYCLTNNMNKSDPEQRSYDFLCT
jgi:hypothetical protein